MADLGVAILKQMYKPGVESNSYKTGGPFWAMLKKRTDFGGKNRVVVQRYSNPTGRSATFSNSQTNRGEGAFGEFTVTRASDYANIKLVNEEIEAAMVDGEQALAELMKLEGDAAFDQITDSLHHGLWQNGGGAVGRVGSISTTALTLLSRFDVVHFHVGQELVASDYDGTGSGTDRSGTATVTAINRSTGVLTTDSNWTAQISGLTANDYLFVQGDRALKIKGAPAWVPYAAPTSTAFFGLDRTADTERLAGIRVDGSSGTIEEALQLLDGEVHLHAGRMIKGSYFLNSKDYAELLTELGNSRRREASVEVAGIGFSGVYVDGPGGSHTAFADFEVPRGYAWLLDMDTWTWWGLGRAPRLLTTGDDLPGLRISNEDATESRFVYRGNLVCDKLICNGVVKLPTAA